MRSWRRTSGLIMMGNKLIGRVQVLNYRFAVQVRIREETFFLQQLNEALTAMFDGMLHFRSKYLNDGKQSKVLSQVIGKAGVRNEYQAFPSDCLHTSRELSRLKRIQLSRLTIAGH